MKTLIILILAAAPVRADLKSSGRVIGTIDIYADAGITGYGGDTYQFTAWTGSSTGGNWNGGHIYGSYNDGHGCPSGGNVAFMEITRVDFTNKTNTAMSCVNGMSSYGNTYGQPAGWTTAGVAWKSYNPFSYNGDIFWAINRQQISSPWLASMSTYITSPDRGLHWCNPATFAAHSGSPGCDSSNYKADGDAPADPSTGMMFGALDDTANPFSRMIHAQFCQDETCTGMPFSADNYLYFVSVNGTFNKLFAACVAKSKASIMDKTQWWAWTGGNYPCGDARSWTHSMASAVAIQDQNELFGYPSSIVWVKEAGQFLMTSYAADYRIVLLTSSYPWGPWKRIIVAPEGGQGGFVSTNLAWLDNGCSGCNTNPGHWRITLAASVYGHTPDATLYLYQMDIQNGGPSTPNTVLAGIANLGRLPIRASNKGVGNRLILNGLVRAFAYDDFLDTPSSAWSSSGTYTRDLLGTTDCVTTGMNPPGFMVWGTQSPTPPISVSGGGIYLGPGYAAQITSNDAECTGALPISGDAAFTVQMVIKPDSVTRNDAGALFYFIEPGLAAASAAHKQFYAWLNYPPVSGGGSIGISDYSSVLMKANPSGLWTGGNYYVLTVVKSPGAFSASTVQLYIGKTQVTLTYTDTGNYDRQPPNLSGNLKLRLGCTGVEDAYCNPGGWQATQFAATHSFFALYNRALSADEVTHNYAALKAAMAQPPRSITVQ